MVDHRSDDFAELEADFAEVMAILAEGPPDESTERPSEAVWAAIAAGLGGQIAADAARAGSATPPETGSVEPRADSLSNGVHAQEGPPQIHDPSAGSHPLEDDFPQPADHAVGDKADVFSLDRQREARRPSQPTQSRGWGRPAAIFTAVAAAVLLVAVPLLLATSAGGGPSQRADLLALGGFAGSGQAELSEQTLEIDVEGLDAPAGSFYELWLLDADGEDVVNELVSLGRIDGDGSVELPDGVDVGQFSVVDISIELDDGNPNHGGNSVLRGPLMDVT